MTIAVLTSRPPPRPFPISASSSLPSSALPAPDRAAAIFRAAGRSCPSSKSGRPSMPARCARPCARPSAAPTRKASGAGRTPMTPARSRRLLFLRKFGAGDARARRRSRCACSRCWKSSPGCCRPIRSARRRARRSSSSRRRIPLAFAAAQRGRAHARRLVLEPSAGTGLLAIFAELAGAQACAQRTRRDPRRAARPRLSRRSASRATTPPISTIISMPRISPSVILMNPPFSAGAKVEGRVADAALRHVASALSRLAEGGRLVAITGASLSPENPTWREAFIRLQEQGPHRLLRRHRRARLCPARHDASTPASP